MAFKAGHVEYTEPRVKALVEKYEPDRFIGPYTTYWVVNDSTGDFMIEITPESARGSDRPPEEYAFLMRNEFGVRRIDASLSKARNPDGGWDVEWMVDRVSSLEGSPIIDAELESVAAAIKAVGLSFRLVGVSSLKVTFSDGADR